MALAVASPGRGRPSNAQLSDRLERSRMRNAILAEARAVKAQSRDSPATILL